MHYKNLVLSGGGVKGIAYLGVYEFIIEKQITFDNVYATSIGSFFAVVMLLKLSPDAVYRMIRNLYKNAATLNVLDVFRRSKGFSLLSHKDYKKIITRLVPENLTFKALYDATGIPLTIVATDLKLQQTKVFSSELTPDTKVYRAIMASTCVPFFLPLQDSRYIDGGVLENLYTDQISKDEDSLLFVLKTYNEYKSESIDQYISNVLRLSFGRTKILNSPNWKYIFIDTGVMSSEVSVLFDKQKINRLVKLGYSTTDDLFKNE